MPDGDRVGLVPMVVGRRAGMHLNLSEESTSSSSSAKMTVPLTCASCKQMIVDEDMVHQVMDLVYHQKCFNCSTCAKPLKTGEKFYGGTNGEIVCARHNEEACEAAKDEPAVVEGVSPLSSGTTSSSACSASGSAAESPTSPSPVSSTKTDSGASATTPTESSKSAASPVPSEEGSKKGASPSASPSKKPPGKRAARAIIKGKVLETLKNTFAVNPKPSRQVRERLCEETGLTMRTVLVWFQHRRSKERWMQNCMSKTDVVQGYVNSEYGQWLNQQYQQQGVYPATGYSDQQGAMMQGANPMASYHAACLQQPMQPSGYLFNYPGADPTAYQTPGNLMNIFNTPQSTSMQPAASYTPQSTLNTPLTQAMDTSMSVMSSPLMSTSLVNSSSMPSLRGQSLGLQMNQSMSSLSSAASETNNHATMCNSTPNLRSLTNGVCHRSASATQRYSSSSDSGLPEDLLSVAEDLASLHGSQHSLFRSPPQPLTPLEYPTTPFGSGKPTVQQSPATNGSTSNLSMLLDGLGPLDNCFDNFSAGIAM